jgi:hypothetical protein
MVSSWVTTSTTIRCRNRRSTSNASTSPNPSRFRTHHEPRKASTRQVLANPGASSPANHPSTASSATVTATAGRAAPRRRPPSTARPAPPRRPASPRRWSAADGATAAPRRRAADDAAASLSKRPHAGGRVFASSGLRAHPWPLPTRSARPRDRPIRTAGQARTQPPPSRPPNRERRQPSSAQVASCDGGMGRPPTSLAAPSPEKSAAAHRPATDPGRQDWKVLDVQHLDHQARDLVILHSRGHAALPTPSAVADQTRRLPSNRTDDPIPDPEPAPVGSGTAAAGPQPVWPRLLGHGGLWGVRRGEPGAGEVLP